MDTSDTSWENCKGPWDRLRWARKRAGLKQEDAAKIIGVGRTAYIKYEAEPGRSNTQNTPLKYEQARPLAKRLKVRWEWLLDRDGTPWLEDQAPGDRVRAALHGVLPDEEVEQIASLTELLDRKRAGA